MKKIIPALSFAIFCIACGGAGSNDKAEAKTDSSATTSTTPANDLSKNPDYVKGLELISKNDCLGCHKVDEKVAGPAYRDVAAKYPNTPENVSMLADKVIKGGTGVWGQIAMSPHPTLSKEDAEAMVKYVLLLKK